MVRNRRYILPRKKRAREDFDHLLEEAVVLVQTIVLQQSGTNLEKYKTLPIKKVSIDSLNDCLLTLKAIAKENMHFLDSYIDEIRDNCIAVISKNKEFMKVITECLKLNLISDNSHISLFLSPYAEYWNLFTAGVKSLVINHIIRSINREIAHNQMKEKIKKNGLFQRK
jgi:hypothetical protein